MDIQSVSPDVWFAEHFGNPTVADYVADFREQLATLAPIHNAIARKINRQGGINKREWLDEWSRISSQTPQFNGPALVTTDPDALAVFITDWLT